ncbi:MAG: J domain-containing protein [Saprospiraceae bacterium]|nr:J domain-containing protein [Saprospiraceae bacterium]
MQDYYTILGVSTNSSKHEIRKAYLKLCKTYHPDLHKGATWAEERLKLINEAYEVLSDAFSRYDYDLNYFQERLPVPVGSNTSLKRATLWSFLIATLFKHYRPVFIALVGFSSITILLSVVALSKQSTINNYSDPVNLKLTSPEHYLFLDFCISHPNAVTRKEFHAILNSSLPKGFTKQLELLTLQGDTLQVKQWINEAVFK